MSADRNGERGMTLVELMIAMIILSIVVTAAFSVAFTVMASYREHRKAMAVERSARGAMQVLSNAVRNASPGVPDGQIIDTVSCSAATDGLRVINASDAPDKLDVVYATGGVVTSTRAAFDQAKTQLKIEDGSALAAGDQIMLTDFDKGHVLPVSAIALVGGEWVVTLAQSPADHCGAGLAAFSYLVRTTVIKVQIAEFSVSDTEVPTLMLDPDGPDGDSEPEPVAEGVEDLQIALGFDTDNDGTVSEYLGAAGDDDEWYYNHPDDTPLGTVVTGGRYRALRLTVTARSMDETTTVATSIRPAAEDRDGASAADVYKRRTLATVIDVRNLKGSP